MWTCWLPFETSGSFPNKIQQLCGMNHFTTDLSMMLQCLVWKNHALHSLYCTKLYLIEIESYQKWCIWWEYALIPNSYSCTMLVPGLLFVEKKKKKEIQTCVGDFTPTCTIFLNSSMMQFLPVDSSSRELVRCFMKMCIVSIIPRSSGRRQRLKMNLHSIFQVPYLFSVFSRYSFC